MTANEASAVGTATMLFLCGILLMFCSSMGLLGLLRKSWKTLASLVVILVGLMFALFAIMTVSFVLGYQMPSLRDLVNEGWQKGCPSPATDTVGCMQAELVANDWCWDHGNQPVPGMFAKDQKDPLCSIDPLLNAATTADDQKKHMCSISCQASMVATLEETMEWIAVGCYSAFFMLIVVVLWNSQTHHGLWCISPSANEDDDENTVMSIPPAMAYVAYLLNGLLGLAGLFVAITAAYLLSSPTSWSAMFAIFLGIGYFIVAAISCFAVAKDLHWILRFCNIAYFVSCVPLLILSLVAAVYSGRIENIYDFYDDHWCDVRGEIDAVQPDYCAKMSDAMCKRKIVDDTADNLAIVGWVILFTLGAIAALIWFSTRLARKFKFDARAGFSDEVSYAEDEGGDDDDKGGDDDEEAEGMNPVHIGLIAAPWVIGIIATILVFALGSEGPVASVDCTLVGAKVDFNGTGIGGTATFTQGDVKNGMTIDLEYRHSTSLYPTANPVTSYEIHEFPVPENGDCSQVGDVYPATGATYLPSLTKVAADTAWGDGVSLLVEAGDHGIESLYYDGIAPVPAVAAGDANPVVRLIGLQAIQGRSLVLKADAATAGCKPNDGNSAPALATAADCTAAGADRVACLTVATHPPGCTFVSTTPACGTISYSGSEWETIANFTDAKGSIGPKIRGSVVFSQVVTRGSESDATIYIELEATEDWDEAADGTPTANGCDTTQAQNYASCGHKMHIHERTMAPDANDAEKCSDYSTGGHFDIDSGAMVDNLAADKVTKPCAAGTDGSAARAADCETGDISGKFIPAGFNIGKKGQPSKYFFVDTYDKLHSILLKGSGTDIGAKSVVMHANDAWVDAATSGANRVACADVPIAYPWQALGDLGR